MLYHFLSSVSHSVIWNYRVIPHRTVTCSQPESDRSGVLPTNVGYPNSSSWPHSTPVFESGWDAGHP